MLKQDMQKLKKVQRREMIWRFEDLSYEQKLKMCRYSTTLQRKRSREDFIEVYKIITEKKELQWKRVFELARSKATRGHMQGQV